MEKKRIIIAIDGPAGSGKSTTAKLLAQRLSFVYLDTGAMYRAVTLKALENRIEPTDEKSLEKIAQDSRIEFKVQDGENKIFLDRRDVTELIREPVIDEHVSTVSKHKKVREILVKMQRELSQKYDLVVEGRDISSVVFPQATVKIYLDADLNERAKRRLKDLEKRKIFSTLEEQKEKLAERDRKDSKREISPLLKHPDTQIVDTTNLSIEKQVEEVLKIYRAGVSKI